MNYKHLIFSILVVLYATLSFAQSSIERSLFELPDVIFTPIEIPEGYLAAYKLMVKQPLDYTDESKGHFYQKVYFSYAGADRPTALITNGYNRDSNNITEVAKLLNANQVNVEHRYFGESIPDSMNYTYLTFEQVTGDLHRIRTLFQEILPSKWVSTGISKGGTTTIFYKYFYPDDVDASIPYVAPLNHEFEENRIYTFLNNKGSVSCREEMYRYQRQLLEDEEENISNLKWFVKGKDLKFTYLNLGEAYEYAVLELPFSFWQYGQDCAKIPSASATREERIQYLLDVVGLDFYSDTDMKAYASHYYQSANQMGYYGYETEPFQDLLNYLPAERHPHAAFTPNKMKVVWDGSLTNKVAKWIKSNGNKMLYINGALDTWSATAVPESKDVDAIWYFMENKHHASARIKNMTKDERNSLVNALERWLDIEISVETKL